MEQQNPDHTFRKGFQLGQGNLLKASVLRRLELPAQFTAKGLKTQKIIGTKIVIYSPGNVAADEDESIDEPLFFQTDPKGMLFPTLYALWIDPTLCPRMETVSGALDSLQRGSDLFRPGVVSVTGVLVKDGPVAICIRGTLLGVGRALMNNEEFEKSDSGAVLVTLHMFGDLLWQMGSKHDPISIEASLFAAAEPSESELQDSIAVAEIQKEKEEAKSILAANVTSAEMDLLLQETFVRALRLRVQKTDLPILYSTFFSKYMLPSAPVDRELNLKKSTYKKIGVFLDSMAKEGAIKVAEKSPGVSQIVELDRSASIYRKFEVEESIESNVEESNEPNPVVTVFYGLPKRMLSIFVNQTELMNKMEARTLLLRRVKELNLLSEEKKGFVNVDEELLAVLKGNVPALMKMQDLVNLWFENLDIWSQTFVGNISRVKKGRLRPITIKEESRGGRKTVTCVSGMIPFGIDVEILSSLCAKLFASSVSVEDEVMQIQGSRSREMSQLLQGECRVPADYVVVEERKTKKKKPKGGKK